MVLSSTVACCWLIYYSYIINSSIVTFTCLFEYHFRLGFPTVTLQWSEFVIPKPHFFSRMTLWSPSSLVHNVLLHDIEVGVWCAVCVLRLIGCNKFRETVANCHIIFSKFEWWWEGITGLSHKMVHPHIEPIIQWPPFKAFLGTE